MAKKWLVRSALALLSLSLCVSLALNFWLYKLYENTESEYQKVQAAFFPASTSMSSVEHACS